MLLDTAVDNTCNIEMAWKVFVQEVLGYWLCDLACFTLLVFLYVCSIQLLTTVCNSHILSLALSSTGAPVVASFPHFYLGDPKYADAIIGLSPKREHHQTFLDLNPVHNLDYTDSGL